MLAGSFSRPSWLKVACDEEVAGLKEIRADPPILAHSRVLGDGEELATVKDVIETKKAGDTKEVQFTGYMMSQVDETAWCACFVNWCLVQAGSQTYSRYGKASVETGAICVIKR